MFKKYFIVFLIVTGVFAALLNNQLQNKEIIYAEDMNLMFNQVEQALATNGDLPDRIFLEYQSGDDITKGSYVEFQGDLNPKGILNQLYMITDLYQSDELDNLIGQLNATCDEPEVNSNHICSGELNYLFDKVIEDINNFSINVSGSSGESSDFFIGVNQGCLIDSSEDLYCWGYNSNGELGLGDLLPRDGKVKVTIPGGEKVSKVWGQRSNLTCFQTKTSKKIYCMGLDNNQYYGLGGNQITTPTELVLNYPNSARPIELQITAKLMCGMFDDGKAYCWGIDVGTGSGATGIASYLTPQEISVPGVTTVDFALGGDGFVGQTVFILGDDDTIYTAGSNWQGNMGVGYQDINGQKISVGYLETIIPAGVTPVELRVSGTNNCFLADNSRIYCWGQNSAGNGETNSFVPVEVPLPVGETVLDYTASSASCAIMNDNDTYCWGSNNAWDPINRLTPEKVSYNNLLSGEYFVKIQSGGKNICGKTNLGNIYCWGLGTLYGNGDGTTINRPIPVFPVQDYVE